MKRRMFLKQTGLTLFGAVSAAHLLTRPAEAHHGWAWATTEEFELTGTIQAVRLGNPHGELTLDVDGEKWIVEIGQPWRNERAGLTEDLLTKGTEVTIHGHRSAREGERLMKAESVMIGGKRYVLYPDRIS